MGGACDATGDCFWTRPHNSEPQSDDGDDIYRQRLSNFTPTQQDVLHIACLACCGPHIRRIFSGIRVSNLNHKLKAEPCH
ncbi:hypothetical protein AVEN_86453-1 [Araneus ventricosus]|uniref:Uncharacterized protein n=1 Tax=Araneus ventricosus TaxID=182803 RepID=A0A4Y2KGB2_ARAVE|nr:hypothetical protein AVEN_86453-1 [Araneus ventricosus]